MHYLVAKTDTDRRLAGLFEPIMKELGYVLVRVRFSGKKTKVLQVMAEREDGSMDIDGCADLSLALSTALDGLDPVPDAGRYRLEVSSPGIDRPLTRTSDFENWKDHRVKLKSGTPIEGRRRFSGILRGLEGDEVLLEIAEGVIGIKLDWLDDARLVLDESLLAGASTGNRSWN